MKLLRILIALSIFTVAAHAQRAVFSTTGTYVLSPTSFGAQLLTNSNAAELLTLIGAQSATGAVTLAGAQTVAGNKSFTNTANVFAGDGGGLTGISFPANSIGLRLLWSCPTNIYLASLATNALLNLTNNGDYAATTPIIQVTLPALLGSNSSLVIESGITRTQANTSAGTIAAYLGPNTNFLGYITPFTATAGNNGGLNFVPLFYNAASFTSQLQGPNFSNPSISAITNFVDTGAPFDIYLGGMTPGDHRNAQMIGLKIYERLGQ